MEIIHTIALVIQVIAAVAVIVLVLLQHGKGADAGAAFGGGSSSASVFGAAGSANFMSRTTAWAATAFVICTILLAFSPAKQVVGSGSVLDNMPAEVAPATSAAPAVAPAAPAPVNNIPK